MVCDDLGMTAYAMYSHLKTELKTKDRADLLEAFLGALYIDRVSAVKAPHNLIPIKVRLCA